jgi:uncharacterized Zn finger protein
MTGHYQDCCPACGSNEAIPYAVIIGASEVYGYQCGSCAVMWPVLHHPSQPLPALTPADRKPAA